MKRFDFLRALVGEQGAVALQGAIERVPDLEKAVVPRAALAWLKLLDNDFDGVVPGSTIKLAFKKSDETYTGTIDIGETAYKFTKSGVYHLVGCITVALGVGPGTPNLQKSEVYRLGMNIDLLIQGRAKQVVQPVPVKKSEPVKKKHSVFPKKKPQRMIKMSKSQAATPCSACGQGQFAGKTFHGCLCFSALAKDVKVTTKPDGYLLTFGALWDEDAVRTLLDSINSSR